MIMPRRSGHERSALRLHPPIRSYPDANHGLEHRLKLPHVRSRPAWTVYVSVYARMRKPCE